MKLESFLVYRTQIAVAVGVLLFLAMPFTALGQSACDDALLQAQKSYDLGLFEDIPAQLGPCLGTRMSRRTAVEVHSLLARAYLNSDEPEKAHKEVSTILRLDATFEAGSSSLFAALVSKVRREELTTQVASVSKTNESLREAPATVVVVTGDEIQRRGYLDLEQLLHDLPGFDISRTNGDIYSIIYQRGYRSTVNDRLLLLIDGVEQNDLSTNAVYLAREYPLTNIDRVEIIYGPASTMYGANAYTGVISILTKEPEGLIGENKLLSVGGQVTRGGYGSHYVDLNLAGKDRSGTLAWSVTGSFANTKERNLSRFPDWDATYSTIDYASLMHLAGPDADDFFNAGKCAVPSPYFQCLGTAAGQRSIELTPAGQKLVREIDSRFITDHGLAFHDRARDWSLFGKLRISNLTLGLETWTSDEGIGSANRIALVAGGTAWKQTATALYLKYSLPLERLKVSVFTRFQQTATDRTGSQYDYLHNYASGYLNLWSLVAPCQAPNDPAPVSCAPATPWIEQANFGNLSDQLRSEITVVYGSSERFNAVAGLEFAKSSIQSQFDETETGAGFFPPLEVKPQQTQHTDVGLYAQGSYKPRPSLKFVFAGRVSHSAITGTPGVSGFGTLFTPRAGIIYMPGSRRLVLKAIYSEAFKDPTDFQKFGTLKFVNEIPSGGLKPERVKNIELSAGWERNGLSLESSLFQAHYSNVVSFRLVPDCQLAGCLQYENRDTIHIRGLQATGRYLWPGGEVWANYTHTAPFQQQPKDLFGDPLLDETGTPILKQRVADIADDRVNAGFDSDWWRGFRGSLKLEYAGARKTGAGTTEPSNPYQQIAAHATADAALSYRVRPNAAIELVVQNLTNKQYYDPGVEFLIGAARIPQAGRTVFLRASYGLSLGGGQKANR